jgi:hypothetical protein
VPLDLGPLRGQSSRYRHRRSIPVGAHPTGAEQNGRVADDQLTQAVVRQLAEDEPDLAVRLAARFASALDAADVSPAERDYLRGYKPVVISAGKTGSGLRVLQFRFAGSTTTIEWDGSESEAEDLVDGIADNAACNVAGDYWIHGRGWEG